MEHRAISTRLTELWQRLLNKPVAEGDDFFELGGDSLAAIKMVMEVQTTYGIDLDVETFFEKPCIANLTTIIAQTAPAAAAHDAPR